MTIYIPKLSFRNNEGLHTHQIGLLHNREKYTQSEVGHQQVRIHVLTREHQSHKAVASRQVISLLKITLEVLRARHSLPKNARDFTSQIIKTSRRLECNKL